jgi:molybdopterin-guanine dinucleotide biosynthesis protein A
MTDFPDPGHRDAELRRPIAAVLAGGGASRMGSPKATLEVDGRRFLDRIVDVLLGAFDMVYVCGGDTPALGASLVHDDHPGEGPLAGIVSALRVAEGAPTFVTAVDMPMLTLETIRRLCVPPVGAGHARIARVDRRPQPLCGMYAGDLEAHAVGCLRSPDRSVMGFALGVPYLELVDIDDGSLMNINTPDDYAALRRFGVGTGEISP